MNNHRMVKILGVVCIVFCASPHLVTAQQIQGLMTSANSSYKDYYFVEPGPVRQSTLYEDGSIIDLQTEIVSWPMIGSDLTDLTLDEFKRMVLSTREAFENDPNKILVSGDGPSRGPNFVFSVVNPPSGAVAALESVATYLESLFDDNVTVMISVNFQPLGPGIIGSTSCSYAGAVSWTNTRDGLINDIDADDSIPTWLPTGSTIPIRYVYTSSTVTNENQIYFTLANYNAAIGYLSGWAASMTFSTNFTFDYDPRDGVTGMCFQSIAAHEIGHVLGFTSGADFRYNDSEILDIYRFQDSDAGFDYNPDDLYEFQTFARMVDKDYGSSLDDVNSDLIEVEYRMSDGTPYQCSHFSQGNVDAIMQPATSYGITYYPCFYRIPDRIMFDATGWDYLLSYYLTITPIGGGSVEKDPDSFIYVPETPVELTAIPDAGWMFDHWTGGLTGNNNPDTVIMDDDITVKAYFLTINCTLTVYVIGNGSVNKEPDLPVYPRGTPVELTAIPDSGWIFNHWSGNLWGSQNPDTIIMDGDKILTAHFIEDTYIAENQDEIVDVTFVDVFPNPFSDRVTIKYSLSVSDRAKGADLTIYDATGQLIKRFSLPAANSQIPIVISWDGRDNASRKIPSGVYFLRLETSDYETTEQILLLR
ncbi:T9SS type A sorting domain-containing protein [candidate division WOR-3 bacterium]|nr:T9SS type A sorting domain-containing protein [candidate division WOR-3 bacterium]